MIGLLGTIDIEDGRGEYTALVFGPSKLITYGISRYFDFVNMEYTIHLISSHQLEYAICLDPKEGSNSTEVPPLCLPPVVCRSERR